MEKEKRLGQSKATHLQDDLVAQASLVSAESKRNACGRAGTYRLVKLVAQQRSPLGILCLSVPGRMKTRLCNLSI